MSAIAAPAPAPVSAVGHCRGRTVHPRHRVADRAKPAGGPARARAPARRHDPADRVHPAVPVRVRLGDPRPGSQLQGLPVPGDHRAVARVRDHRRRRRHIARHDRGRDRPLPLAADQPAVDHHRAGDGPVLRAVAGARDRRRLRADPRVGATPHRAPRGRAGRADVRSGCSPSRGWASCSGCSSARPTPCRASASS